MSAEEAVAVQESLLILLTGLLETAADLASHEDVFSRLGEIENLCNDAEAVAALASSLIGHQGGEIPAPPA